MPALPPAGEPRRPPPDLRAVVLGVSGWAGALVVLGLPGWTCWVLLALGSLLLVARRRRRRPVVTMVACLLAAAAVGGVTGLRADALRHSPVAALAGERAVVTLTARVSSDPVLRDGRFGSYTLTRVTVTELTGRGRHLRTHVPVLVIGEESWRQVSLGATVTDDRAARPAGLDRTWPGCCRPAARRGC